VAETQITSISTEDRIVANSEDLSLFGCRVQTAESFSPGTKVRVRISHAEAIFSAEGRITYSPNNARMGIVFTSIEPSSLSVLNEWLTQLRK